MEYRNRAGSFPPCFKLLMFKAGWPLLVLRSLPPVGVGPLKSSNKKGAVVKILVLDYPPSPHGLALHTCISYLWAASPEDQDSMPC